jgi:hypothetical protein
LLRADPSRDPVIVIADIKNTLVAMLRTDIVHLVGLIDPAAENTFKMGYTLHILPLQGCRDQLQHVPLICYILHQPRVHGIAM